MVVRLPAAVVAEDADDLALVDVEIDVEDDVLASPAGLQLLDREKRHTAVAVRDGCRRARCQAVPKYASASSGELVSSATVPCGGDASELHEVGVIGEPSTRRGGCARRCTPCGLAPSRLRRGRAWCRPTWCRCRTPARRAAARRPRWRGHGRARRASSGRSDSAPAGTSAKSFMPTKLSHPIAFSRVSRPRALRPGSVRTSA